MTYKLSMLAEAESEYEKAIKWYKKESIEVTLQFISEVADALEAIENNPAFYGFYHPPYRRILLRSFSFKIVYEIAGEKVIIHAIYHSSRNDLELRKRLP